MPLVSRWNSVSSKWNALFRDHEIYVRTGGDVRFLRLSARLQRRAAGIVVAVVSLWLLATATLLGWQAYSGWQNRDVAARAIAVERAEARVAAENGRIEDTAARLDQRQDYFEAVFEGYFADSDTAKAAADPAATGQPGRSGKATPAIDTGPKQDQLSRLYTIEARQLRLVATLTDAVAARSARAEAALRTVGIRTDTGGGRGGPLLVGQRLSVPIPRDPAFLRLAAALDRMELLEGFVVALPSNLPAEHMSLSSGFGYRRDPFTGGSAMHAGLDFTGAHGSTILAAAAGQVVFVGQKSGYGNVVEIDHGHGILTRYAHLSAFATRVGQAVVSGENIARMGSTGRSTGTHLHFEVRVNGAAVNPRRFLETNPDVLEVKADADGRVRARVAAR